MTLCNDAVENPDGTVQGEPTEAALVRFGVDSGLDKTRLEAGAAPCGGGSL